MSKLEKNKALRQKQGLSPGDGSEKEQPRHTAVRVSGLTRLQRRQSRTYISYRGSMLLMALPLALSAAQYRCG